MAFPVSSHRWNFIGRSRLILLLIDHLFDLVCSFYAAGTHHAPLEGEKAVVRARQLPCGSSSGEIFGQRDGFAT